MTIAILLVIAQAISPPGLDGITGAGWVGTGLLSSVLAWIFFSSIPAKDKQIAGLIADHTAQVRELNVANQEAIKSLVADFRSTIADLEKRASEMDRERRHDFNGQLQMVTNHYEKELGLTNQAIRRDLDEMSGVMGDLRSLINEIRDKNMQLWSRPTRPNKPGPQSPPQSPPPQPPSPPHGR